MKKKILTIACSTVLGLTGGMRTYAGVNCTPGGLCEVTDGDQADLSGQAYEALNVINSFTVPGTGVSVIQGTSPQSTLMMRNS